MPELPANWELLNFPGVVSITEKGTGRIIHNEPWPYEGGISAWDLKARAIDSALKKAAGDKVLFPEGR